MQGFRRVAQVASLALCLALTACGGNASSGSSSDASASRAGLPDFSHVVVVVMENHEYGRIVRAPQAPYINSLARQYAIATRYHAVSHPSLPNYLALTGGRTFNITSDCTQCPVSRPNLVDQLEQAHISWKAYMEGMPSPCYSGAVAGRYAKKHDPFLYYDDIVKRRDRCSKVVPLSELDGDVRAGKLARFAWITPDLCHDMHDCSVAAGDSYLHKLLPPILDKLGSNGALFLTWDEGSSKSGCCKKASGGHVATIVAGPAARHGARSAMPFDHYSLLRTIEEAWKLPKLGDAGCPCTHAMIRLFSAK